MQIKYGPMFPDPGNEGLAEEIIKRLFDICKCGHKMEEDAKFCSNCGLPREDALRHLQLTDDEKKVLAYIEKCKTVDVNSLGAIPFIEAIIGRFLATLNGLVEKGLVVLYRNKAELKNLHHPAHTP